MLASVAVRALEVLVLGDDLHGVLCKDRNQVVLQAAGDCEVEGCRSTMTPPRKIDVSWPPVLAAIRVVKGRTILATTSNERPGPQQIWFSNSGFWI